MRRMTTAVIMVAGVLAMSATVAGGGGGQTLTVNPTSGMPGDSFTVSGADCTPVLEMGVQGFAPAGNGPPIFMSTVNVTVQFPTPVSMTVTPDQESGEWSASFTVPAGTPPGTYDVTAECINEEPLSPDAVDAQDFTYAPGTVYTVQATPATAPAVPAPAGTEEPAPVPVPVAAAPASTG